MARLVRAGHAYSDILDKYSWEETLAFLSLNVYIDMEESELTLVLRRVAAHAKDQDFRKVQRSLRPKDQTPLADQLAKMFQAGVGVKRGN